MTHDKPDYDREIAAAERTREQAQAKYDLIKYSSDSCNIIDRRAELNDANRRLIELRQKRAVASPLEALRSSSIFVGSNN